MTKKEMARVKVKETPDVLEARARFWQRSADTTTHLCNIAERGLKPMLVGETIFVMDQTKAARPLTPQDIPRDYWAAIRQALRDEAQRVRVDAEILGQPGWTRGPDAPCGRCCAACDTYHEGNPTHPRCEQERRDRAVKARGPRYGMDAEAQKYLDWVTAQPIRRCPCGVSVAATAKEVICDSCRLQRDGAPAAAPVVIQDLKKPATKRGKIIPGTVPGQPSIERTREP